MSSTVKLTRKGDVFIHCRLGALTYILTCVYIPPAFTAVVLQLLIFYMDGMSDVPLLVIGDFNCCLDPMLDRHVAPGTSALSRGPGVTPWQGGGLG